MCAGISRDWDVYRPSCGTWKLLTATTPRRRLRILHGVQCEDTYEALACEAAHQVLLVYANMVDHDALDYKLNLLSFADLLRLKKDGVLVRPQLLMAAGPALGDWERVQLGMALCIRDRPGGGTTAF